MSEPPVALVTGAARRIGAVIAERLHAEGYNVAVHCRGSRDAAAALAERLNTARAGSAAVFAADLLVQQQIEQLVHEVLATFGRIDMLVNNASAFYPTRVGSTTREQWDELIGSNFTAPYFLVQAAMPALNATRGNIINLLDIHAERPMAGHAVYSAAKAGTHMLTRALAQELAPAVRVNGIAPGAILWPENGGSEADRERIIANTPLQRSGSPEDIARTVLFLANSPFITGQVIAVDGGRNAS